MSAPTKESIRELLLSNDRIVERAIVVIYNRQTATEQRAGMTNEHNGRGFSSSDAHNGTYMAKWILSGKRLSGKWMAMARKMSLTYIRQLVEEAEAKYERQLVNRPVSVDENSPEQAQIQAALNAAMAAARSV